MSPDPGSTPAPTDSPIGRCESCGDEAVAVATVRRLYLVAATDDQAEHFDPADADERWCFACRTQYPHEVRE